MMISDLEIAELLPQLDDSSRVWIYQAESTLNEHEVNLIAKSCNQFIPAWKAHGKNLEADYRILFNRFICFFVDESGQDATGCSIDSSVHFIQQLERSLNKGLMQRTTAIFLDQDGLINEVEINEMKDKIDLSSLVFNNLVGNLGEMKTNWLVPARESWHARMI